MCGPPGPGNSARMPAAVIARILTTWSEQYYHRLAGRSYAPLRRDSLSSPACRCNFASFRPCKEKPSWRTEEPQSVTEETSGVGQ